MKIEGTNRKRYNILLGGSTFAGKSTYFNSYFGNEFSEYYLSNKAWKTKELIKKLNNTTFYLLDTYYWGGRYDNYINRQIEKDADGIILMFDLSRKKDFDDLPRLLNLITECHELENFPVLLIGNKSDLDINVDKYEINEFLDKEKFIGYFEVSCKLNKNVQESVDFMVDYIYKKEKRKFYNKNKIK